MECPQRSSSSQQSSGNEVSNFAATAQQETVPMEVITEVPPHTLSLAEMMRQYGSDTAPSLLHVVQQR